MNYSIEIDGKTVLQTDNVDDLVKYVRKNNLLSSSNVAHISCFPHIALSRDGDLICGFVFKHQDRS